MKADVSVTEDGICINFPNVLITLDDDGLGYAILEGGSFRAGKFNEWPKMSEEINAALAIASAADGYDHATAQVYTKNGVGG